METRLKQAIDHLYETFKAYNLKGELRERSCSCCVTDEEILLILAKPLRELTEEELGHFSRSAMTTFGDIEDYKHFLPRILELLAKPHSDFLFDFTCFEKLNYAEWKTWPIEEQQCIENFFKILWHVAIHDENSSDYRIEGLLEVMTEYCDLEEALLVWSESETLTSGLYIVDAVFQGFKFKIEKEKDTIFSEWLFSEKMLSKLEELFYKTDDTDLANRISIAHTILENKQFIAF